MTPGVRQYLLITANYWAFTLTDGALRMLVVLYFHQLGYGPLQIALLFLFYELFGVITNLIGGWLGAKLGLNRTMNLGLGLQLLALAMLLVPTPWLTVPWVMAAQALSGIAKDLNKMSAKSAIKLLVPKDQQGTLFKWVAVLTGSKNALKGLGFFMGGWLLWWLGFQGAILAMLMALTLVWGLSLWRLQNNLGQLKAKVKFTEIFSKSHTINVLSAARLALFAARDVWFVVALPVFLVQSGQWNSSQVGAFIACWIIGYGLVQSFSPKLIKGVPDGQTASVWALALLIWVLAMSAAQSFDWAPLWGLLIGLLGFGVLFALNSSVHSFLIVHHATADGVSLDVGFYYMANAAGRLLGTVLSGWLFQYYGLAACLWVSCALLGVSTWVSLRLPRH